MVTPFDASGAVDYALAASVAQFLVAQGNDALVVAGSTGEGSALTDEEKLELFSVVAAAVSVPVIAGTSSPDTAKSVALTAEASRRGIAGILATTPSYVRPSQAGIAAHLGAMAEATNLPVMLYDIPARAGRKIAAATTVELFAKHRNIVAVKDASGDLVQAAQYRAAIGPRCELYSGDDALTLPFLGIGAVGVVSVAGHWAAPEFLELLNAHRSGNIEDALLAAARLLASCSFEGNETYPNPQPAKAALRYLGLPVGHCRLPLGVSDVALDADAKSVIDALRASR